MPAFPAVANICDSDQKASFESNIHNFNLTSPPPLVNAFTADMQKFAIPKKIHIESSPWTPEEGLVTAAFKLKRKALQAKYDAEIASLYQK